MGKKSTNTVSSPRGAPDLKSVRESIHGKRQGFFGMNLAVNMCSHSIRGVSALLVAYTDLYFALLYALFVQSQQRKADIHMSV